MHIAREPRSSRRSRHRCRHSIPSRRPTHARVRCLSVDSLPALVVALVVLLSASSAPRPARAASYARQCALTSSHPVEIAYDTRTGDYTVLGPAAAGGNDPDARGSSEEGGGEWKGVDSEEDDDYLDLPDWPEIEEDKQQQGGNRRSGESGVDVESGGEEEESGGGDVDVGSGADEERYAEPSDGRPAGDEGAGARRNHFRHDGGGRRRALLRGGGDRQREERRGRGWVGRRVLIGGLPDFEGDRRPQVSAESFEDAVALPALSKSRALEDKIPRTIVLTALSCPCAPTPHTYCLFGAAGAGGGGGDPADPPNTCGLPRDPSRPVGCYSLSTRTVFIRNAWPVVVLWYGALLIFLVATDNGRNARNWVLGKVCRGRNEAMVGSMLERERELRERVLAMRRREEVRRMRREALGDRADEEQEDEQEFTGTLILKTRKFDAKKEAERRRRRRERKKAEEAEAKLPALAKVAAAADEAKTPEAPFEDEADLAAAPTGSLTSLSDDGDDVDDGNEFADAAALGTPLSRPRDDGAGGNAGGTPDTAPDSTLRSPVSAAESSSSTALSSPPPPESGLCRPCASPGNAAADEVDNVDRPDLDQKPSGLSSSDAAAEIYPSDEDPDEERRVEEVRPSAARYPSSSSEDDDDDDDGDDDIDFTCTICIAPLEDGQRVGVLPCRHLFHAPCLKEWIKRRNVCPLCQEGGIATPRMRPRSSAASPASGDGEGGFGTRAAGAGLVGLELNPAPTPVSLTLSRAHPALATALADDRREGNASASAAAARAEGAATPPRRRPPQLSPTAAASAQGQRMQRGLDSSSSSSSSSPGAIGRLSPTELDPARGRREPRLRRGLGDGGPPSSSPRFPSISRILSGSRRTGGDNSGGGNGARRSAALRANNSRRGRRSGNNGRGDDPAVLESIRTRLFSSSSRGNGGGGGNAAAAAEAEEATAEGRARAARARRAARAEAARASARAQISAARAASAARASAAAAAAAAESSSAASPASSSSSRRHPAARRSLRGGGGPVRMVRDGRGVIRVVSASATAPASPPVGAPAGAPSAGAAAAGTVAAGTAAAVAGSPEDGDAAAHRRRVAANATAGVARAPRSRQSR